MKRALKILTALLLAPVIAGVLYRLTDIYMTISIKTLMFLGFNQETATGTMVVLLILGLFAAGAALLVLLFLSLDYKADHKRWPWQKKTE